MKLTTLLQCVRRSVITALCLCGGLGWLSFGAERAAELPAKIGNAYGAEAPNEYVLSAKDVIFVRVLNEGDLDTRAIVSEDGRIQMPLIGELKVGGKTAEQARQQIREALAKDYLVNPQVVVSVMESSKEQAAKQGFTVLGQVNRPGLYALPLEKPIDLLNAIAMAGGFTRTANPAKVVVRRLANGQTTTFKLDASAMAKESASQAFIIQADDTITVTEKIF